MKSFVEFFVLFLAGVALACPSDEKYTDLYGNMKLDDVLTVLSNKRRPDLYIKCILGQNKCTPDAEELKEQIRDALEGECSKCTETQKDGTRRVIKHAFNHGNGKRNQLNAKYDPERKYTVRYVVETALYFYC
ncbi:ejaculatory bulb-specific protein 3-like [Anticarsia gemmatalis]|uniref:ejaculatory bulb-specific protein 3-like n=1 Tax=Anticarsia gemmatalis TaxID=129554 RepID=UPI003F75F386